MQGHNVRDLNTYRNKNDESRVFSEQNAVNKYGKIYSIALYRQRVSPVPFFPRRLRRINVRGFIARENVVTLYFILKFFKPHRDGGGSIPI